MTKTHAFLNTLLFTTFILLTGCTTKATTPAPTTTPKESSIFDKANSCICTKIWLPVCGENKKTYGNSCEAECAGVKYAQGACGSIK